MLRRAIAPLAIYLSCTAVYVGTLGPRLTKHTADNHYSHLAASFLKGELGVLGNRPPGTNDWACYDTQTRGTCPNNKFSFPREPDRYRWYVSFPPLPAVVLMPFVAVAGTDFPDALVWALFAGLAPMLLYLLLRKLRESGRSARRPRQDVLLSGLFGLGTVFHFTAVQGSVWFAAHVVAVPLIILYVRHSLGAVRPWLAGGLLGLAFFCRPTTLLLSLFFAVEALAAARSAEAPAFDSSESVVRGIVGWLRAVSLRDLLRRYVSFAVPLVALLAIAAWMNHARFDHPFEFGHSYLQVYWRERIERWGLFNFHFLPRNLALFLAGLPWLSAAFPYIKIGRHGLALWFTTPNLLWTIWPKRGAPTLVGLYVAAIAVLIMNLCYQNSGWIQFGYRFGLDYLPLLFVALALGGRRFGGGFWALAVFAVAMNTFGAITFDRMGFFYDDDASQSRMFQPD